MAWVGSSRCLHCGRKLTLYRVLANEEFCSAAHRQAFLDDQNRLGLERLSSARQELKRLAFNQDVDYQVPPGVALPDLALSPVSDGVPVLETASLAEAIPVSERLPETEPDTASPNREEVARNGIWREPGPDLYCTIALPKTALSQWSETREPKPCLSIAARTAPGFYSLAAQERTDALPSLKAITNHPVWSRQLQMQPRECGAQNSIAADPVPYELRSGVEFPTFNATPAPSAAMCSPETEPEEIRGLLPTGLRQVPFMALLPLAPPQKMDRRERRSGHSAEPIPLRARLWAPLEIRSIEARMRESGLRSLPLSESPLVHGIWIDELDLLETKESAALIPVAVIPVIDAAGPRPVLALCCSSAMRPVLAECAEKAVLAPEPAELHGQIRRPRAGRLMRAARMMAQARQFPIQPATKHVPANLIFFCVSRLGQSGPLHPPAPPAPQIGLSSPHVPAALPQKVPLVAMPFEGAPQDCRVPMAWIAVAPETPVNPPLQPPSRLSLLRSSRRHTAWIPIPEFWDHIPRHPRLIAILAPLLILAALLTLAALHPSLPQVAAANSKPASELTAAVSGHWRMVKHTISNRAGVDFADDFRAGLDNWISRADATAGWTYDAAGFVRPGSLALYQPSMTLSDYQVELLAQVDRKALGVVVRASGFDHYQVVKLAILQSGPLPKVAVLHYPVIDGKAGPKTEMPLPLPVRSDTVYHLRIQTRGPDFMVYVEDQMVALWSDNRFRNGGVGLFCNKGEDARVRWIEVMHQYDALGRLCAYLAPYGVQTSNGSWTQP